MNNVTAFTVAGMTCGHCVASVTNEVSKIANVKNVDVDLATGTVTVESEGEIDGADFAAAVDEAGYEVAA
jgi:copper chaperone CopZ